MARQEKWSRIEGGRARYAVLDIAELTPGDERVVVTYELMAELMGRAGFRLCGEAKPK